MSACDDIIGGNPWNNPYPAKDSDKNILYSSFDKRPKHLDPVRSFSSNEYSIIANIYEPPLQYHYLRRPYELIGLTATAVPEPYFIDERGKRLSADALADQVAWSIYDIEIQSGIHYQPHPALAINDTGHYIYHDMTEDDLVDIDTLSDFSMTGTRELTAADYVYQIKRLAHPETHSPIFSIMKKYIGDLGEYAKRLESEYRIRAGSAHAPVWLNLREYDLASVNATGRYRYRIRIKGKYPQFKYWLTMPFFAPMPWEADRFYSQPGMKNKNLSLDWYPIGTGPYMLTENNPNLRMVLQRNPNFHGEAYPSQGMADDVAAGMLADSGKAVPFIDTVVNSLEKESIPRWNKFLQGYYDISGITSDAFDQAIKIGGGGELSLSDGMQDKGIQLSTAIAASTYYLGFNMLDEVVGHAAGERGKYLRQAISIAVDYEEYISIFLNGRGRAGQGPLPPGIYGYQDGAAGVNPVTHDWKHGRAVRRPLEDALELMVKAGYPGGRDSRTGDVLKLYYDVVAQGPDSKARLSWWRKQFSKLGIELVVRPTDYNRFQDKMLKGMAQLFSLGWHADYPDPENFLFLLYGANGKVEHQGENAGNYNNPDFNKLFEQMKHMEDSPRRLTMIHHMIDILREDAPWLWGLHPKSFVLYHDWYSNAKPHLMANNTLKYKRIDPKLRAKKRIEWNQPVIWPIGLILILFVISVTPVFIGYYRRQHARPELANE